jgi:membrane protease YdiL (CAAX protease family)
MHQRRINALTSRIIVAFLSGLWHLPRFFTAKYPMAAVPYIIWLIEHSAAVVFLTWLYNSTRGSVLITTIFHAARNTVGVLILLAAGGLPLRGFYLELVAVAIADTVVVWRFGASNIGLVNGERRRV